MRPTNIVNVGISPVSFSTKQSFLTKISQQPRSTFHYFYILHMKQMQISNPDQSVKNSSFKIFIRRQWDQLSIAKKRLYRAMYCYSSNIDYQNMSKYQLAHKLNIKTPPVSEYLYFRNEYKKKNDQTRPNTQITSFNVVKYNVWKIKRKVSNTQICNTKEYTQMCRECKRIWNKDLNEQQRAIVREKWEKLHHDFENTLKQEKLSLCNSIKHIKNMNYSLEMLSMVQPALPPESQHSNDNNSTNFLIFLKH